MLSDVITVAAPMANPVDELVRYALEDIKDKKEKLLVILETDGGSIEVAERMANLFRHHYPNHVSFLVPNFAMSAGTVLVMSGDSIYMDYFSVLGPIDPQVKSRTKGDVFIPAIGCIEKYQDFVKRSAQGKLTDIEVMFFVDKFDPAELHFFEQARELSVDLLKNWLVNFKFKDWSVTETAQTIVTKAMKEKRAAEIARKLNDVKKWKSHGRTLSKTVIEKELNLKIDDFGNNKELNDLVRPYYRLLQDYMQRVRHSVVIHTTNNYQGF
jgi:membrane-bound ClpP family serine protease